jgi:hypothetical protein
MASSWWTTERDSKQQISSSFSSTRLIDLSSSTQNLLHQIFPEQALKSPVFTKAIYQDMDGGYYPT